MLRVFAWLTGKLKAVLGLMLPVYQKARGSGGMPRWLYVVLHVLVVAVFLAGLLWINIAFASIPENISAPKWQRNSWLPIIILLIYFLCWMSYWLWKLLVSSEEGPYFPDIEAAWEKAKMALHRAGIGFTDQPLLLILGQPEDDEKALFQAAQLTLQVQQTPSSPDPPRPDTPLHIYATRDATYVTCAGASLLGCHARFLAGKPMLGDKTLPRYDEVSNEEDEKFKTIAANAKHDVITADMAKMFHDAEREGRPLDKLTKPVKRKLRADMRKGKSPLKNPALIAYEAARLRFLCQLLVRDRRPYVPVNGILLLIPFAGCDSEEDAMFTAVALQRDLAITRTTLQVDCPHFALVCDMETAEGFDESIQHFEPDERLRRLGQRCPLNPDLRDPATREPARDGVTRMLTSLAEWLCQSFMLDRVYKLFQIEKADAPDRAELVRKNGRLFLLGYELQVRRPRLATILSHGLAQKAAAGPLLFGGCYLAGTGSDLESEQAFVRGPLARLDEEQNNVYWTQATLAEEAVYAFWVNIGWNVIVTVVAGVVILMAVRWFILD
jgi:hypothetical protein